MPFWLSIKPSSRSISATLSLRDSLALISLVSFVVICRFLSYSLEQLWANLYLNWETLFFWLLNNSRILFKNSKTLFFSCFIWATSLVIFWLSFCLSYCKLINVCIQSTKLSFIYFSWFCSDFPFWIDWQNEPKLVL